VAGLLVLAWVFWQRGLLASSGPWGRGATEAAPLALWTPGLDALLVLVLFGALAAMVRLLRRRLAKADRLIVLAFGTLVLVGSLMLIRLAPDLALHRQRAVFGALAAAHMKVALLACMVFLAAALGTTAQVLSWIGRWKYMLLASGIGLIAATLAVGITLNARRLWLTVGAFAFQPVELLKLLVVLFLAFYLAHEAPALRLHVPHPFAWPPLHTVRAGALMVVLALSALALQRDFGPVVQLYLVSGAMAYLATGSLPVIGASLATFLGGGALAYLLGVPSIVRTRLDMWANPFDLSEGMARALWAIASGGLWGRGFGVGHPEMVPVVHSDYILVAIAEELGFIGVASVLAVYAVLLLRGYTIAFMQPTLEGRLLAAGVTTLLAVQVVIVSSGNAGWIPVTGLTLPGISHGGTSLLVTAASLGVLTRLSAETYTVVGRLRLRPVSVGPASSEPLPAIRRPR
jgi:cell division protein FtsW (lipid II flippase)